MNEVAQAIINQNVIPPVETDLAQLITDAPDGGITTAFDPDSFLAGFGMA